MGGWAAVNLAAVEPGLRAVAAVAPVGGPEMMTPKTRLSQLWAGTPRKQEAGLVVPKP